MDDKVFPQILRFSYRQLQSLLPNENKDIKAYYYKLQINYKHLIKSSLLVNLPGLTTSSKGHLMICLCCFREYTNLSVYVLDGLPNSQAILLVVPKAFNSCVFYTKGICLS